MNKNAPVWFLAVFLLLAIAGLIFLWQGGEKPTPLATDNKKNISPENSINQNEPSPRDADFTGMTSDITADTVLDQEAVSLEAMAEEKRIEESARVMNDLQKYDEINE